MHVAILGTSGSGKSTLATILARELKGRGFTVGVLDPDVSPHWPADHLTDDAPAFLRWARRQGLNGPTAAFVEEPGQSIDPRDRELWPLATRIRKQAVRSYFVMLRWGDLPPAMRGQVTRVFVFNCYHDDAREMARRFNCPLIEQAGPTLKVGEFITVRGLEARRGRVVRERKRWKIVFDR